MSKTVARTCTELAPDGAQAADAVRKVLSDYRSVHAYVLLGDAGSGKTTAFQSECDALGGDALFITARDFLLHAPSPSGLSGKTLFIDGLDEVRAGKQDARTPFDEIRKLLVQLEQPRFRISCREADWLGKNDRERLTAVVPHASVVVLRLNPLTEVDALEILSNNLGVSTPENFIFQAHDEGLGGLLDNPQTLELLVRAVNRGKDWPKSRLQVFDLACSKMASERNREHQITIPSAMSPASPIDCAGRLCALLLLSGACGYSLDIEAPSDRYVPQSPCGEEHLGCLRVAVSSKLFKADSERCFSPIHRQIAEFLAAKHLARLISDGLSPRRVLALMTGSDGVAVTALRGLSAWLATHNEAVRAELIGKNPVELGIYGDLDSFSGNDKQRMLEALLAQPMSLSRAFLDVGRFSSLVANETEPKLRSVLLSRDDDSEHEVRVRFLLLLLSVAKRRPALTEVILGILRDSSRPAQVRTNALAAYFHYQNDHSRGGDQLKALLDEFKAEGISIANRDLCGALLRRLYPKTVGPGQVWDYMSHLGGAVSWDQYLEFWRKDLVAQSTEADIEQLLDALSTSISHLASTIDALSLWKLPIELLRLGLVRHGDEVEFGRINAWLGTCSAGAERYRANPPESLLGIREWLESHPQVQKQVILTGLESCQDGEGVRFADFESRKRLAGAKLPSDFGRWCLIQAVKLADTRPEAAKYLLRESYRALDTPSLGEGLSIEVLSKHARQHPLLAGALRQIQTPPPVPQHEVNWRQKQATFVAEQENEQKELLSAVLTHQSRLLQNSAPPALLYHLALVYFGEGPVVGSGSIGAEAIGQVLKDRDAVDAAVSGLRSCLNRDDLPNVREITRLAKDRREHYLNLPLLVSLQEGQNVNDDFWLDLDESRLRTCVACLHCWEPSFLGVKDSGPAWYQTLLDRRPKIVSDVAVQCAAGALRSSQMISPRFWELLENQRCGSASFSAVLGLLGTLPTRCNARQLEALDELLGTGFRFGLYSQLLGLAETKLSKRSIDAGQKVRWLVVGLICERSKYADELAEAVRGKQRLVGHLARFLAHGDDSYSPDSAEARAWHSVIEDLEPPSLALIVHLVGRFFPPFNLEGFGVISDKLRVSSLLNRVINSLSASPRRTAIDELDSLLKDPGLSDWHPLLSVVRTAQRTLRRDAEYHHPILEQVCETLNGGGPANACDLAALTIDKIEEVALRIATSNSNEWRQYWNEALRGVPSRPKVEDACRDALLAALRPLLPKSVSVEPEGQHVNRNRADLVVTADELKVPVETKRNDSADIWSGIDCQLVAKYTLDPATGGYGIYLVFWFGEQFQKPRADGVRPKNPQDLERLLQDSLTEDQARKIQVTVIDVCRPSTHPNSEIGNSESNA